MQGASTYPVRDVSDISDVTKELRMAMLDRSISRRAFARSTVVLGAGIAAGARSAAVLAQDATPAPAPALPPLPEGATLVADGLWNPRFIAISDAGVLYVTENGIGGDEVVSPPAVGTGELEGTPGATPVAEEAAAEEPPVTRGYTGQITAVGPDGTKTVVASGLASYSIGVGPVGIALGPGEVYFSIGGAAVGQGLEPLPEENTVNRLVLESGEIEQVAAIGPYEVENNPDGTDVNPNLYQLAVAQQNTLLVTDAGGNTLYRIDPAANTFALEAVIPDLSQLPGAPAGSEPRQPVPTGVVVAGGTTFVGLLSEFWPEGAPSVLTVGADGALAVVTGPLFYCVGLMVGPDQQIYASQLFGPPAEGSQDPGPGSVVRIYGDGTVETVLENVMMPHGLAFDVAGNMYVAINSLMSGPGMAAGQVIRIDGVATVG
jgi:hypothetical protein